ncbi:FAD/NAD(P)-binding domain-containing protein [Suillus tomentosus]|nr:FAD/NAD(P)-binding domain-containing protein [Suillus tomentosus]
MADMTSMPNSTTVLIVGAGPSGLATALSLLHHGFKHFVVVDAVEQGENTSRALVVHAATLEALDTIDCGEEIVAKGTKARSINIGNRSSKLVSTNLSSLDKHTRHPYALIIPQSLTEYILGEKLKSYGVTVHRPCKVISLKMNEDDDDLTDVVFEDGKTITAKYVIGADGARSVVRQMAGISFTDPKTGEKGDRITNLAQMVIADIVYEGGDKNDLGFLATMSPESFFLSMPLPNSFNDLLAENGQEVRGQIYRIGAGVPLVDGEIPHSPSKEYLQNLVDRFGPTVLSSDPSVNPSSTPVRIKEIIWATRFRTHSAIAEKAFTRLGGDELQGATGAADNSTTKRGGIILLIGDAAHIHSPAGGQGMNLGIRDAVFLGDALIKHINASTSQPSSIDADYILREFAEERHKRALEVIAFTKNLLSLLGTQDKKISWLFPISATTVRDWVMWLGGKLSFMQARMAWAMSGLGRR